MWKLGNRQMGQHYVCKQQITLTNMTFDPLHSLSSIISKKRLK